MRITYLLNGALLPLLLMGSSVTLAQTPENAAQAPPGLSAPSYSLIYSEQTFVLARGSTIYNKWKDWIGQQNAQNALRLSQRHDGTTSALDGAGGIGKITITVQTLHSSDLLESAATSPAPPDNGPPVGLPPTGTPGQRITVVNQTTTVYQRWTYEWQAAPDGHGLGDGNWVEIRYEGNSCSSGGTSPSLCKLMEE